MSATLFSYLTGPLVLFWTGSSLHLAWFTPATEIRTVVWTHFHPKLLVPSRPLVASDCVLRLLVHIRHVPLFPFVLNFVGQQVLREVNVLRRIAHMNGIHRWVHNFKLRIFKDPCFCQLGFRRPLVLEDARVYIFVL